jgi:hypothetical protein
LGQGRCVPGETGRSILTSESKREKVCAVVVM